jgi:hypothetical protein
MSSLCQTTSDCWYKGCDGILKLSDCGAVNLDSGDIDFSLFTKMRGQTSMDISESATTEELEIFGDCFPEVCPGTTTYNLNFGGVWCKDDPIYCLLRAGCAVQFCWSPTGQDPNTNADACAYVGELLITNFQHTAPWGQKQQFVLQGRGNRQLIRHNWCTNVIPFQQRQSQSQPRRQPFTQQLLDQQAAELAKQKKAA